jgi:pyrroline-5-carboxylate reductase
MPETIRSLGFIGAGNMATAIAQGVVQKRRLAAEACAFYDIDPAKGRNLADALGGRACDSARQVMESCATVIVATKPQTIRDALGAMAPHVTPKHLIVSIAAGVPCSKIEGLLPEGTRVVRVMPNTPALIGMGATAVAGGSRATSEDVESVVKLFQTVGIAARVDESLLDAVTAVSGSGPAYVFRYMELMRDAAIELGFDPQLAEKFTLQTFLGAALLVEQSAAPLEELRRRVTSPGGTTAAALEVFEDRELEALVKDALRAARDRAKDLADRA